jgi:alkyl sulfatase BDS1-like metallo-beta-lactamase superfamily hydrolase
MGPLPANAAVEAALDFTDSADFERVNRGRLAQLDPPVIQNADGHVVWDLGGYDFIEGDAPPR